MVLHFGLMSLTKAFDAGARYQRLATTEASYLGLVGSNALITRLPCRWTPATVDIHGHQTVTVYSSRKQSVSTSSDERAFE